MTDEKRITLKRADLKAMSQGQLTRLLMAASEVRATAVVIGLDGKVKYDDPSKAGQFGEETLNGGS